MSTFAHPNPGFELDWLAVDDGGRVALFSTGGQGAVPRVVVENLLIVQAAIERLHVLPILGDCADQPGNGGDFTFWTEPCRRGVYGFDWGPVSVGPYARITTPSRPVLLDQLQDSLVQQTANLVQLRLDFRNAFHIEAAELGIELNK